MNFNENDLWRDKTELLNLRLSKLPSTKTLLRLEFDTEDEVLFSHIFFGIILYIFEQFNKRYFKKFKNLLNTKETEGYVICDGKEKNKTITTHT